MTLDDFFTDNNKAAIAFSGGVDPSYLLYAAIKAGIYITAYFVKGAFQPEFELRDAEKLALSVGAKLKILYIDVLQNEDITKNPWNRCYYCKSRSSP